MKNIKSVFNDTYEVSSEDNEFCGDCEHCKNECKNGIRMNCLMREPNPDIIRG